MYRNTLAIVALMLPLAIAPLTSEYGPLYDHFKRNPLNLSQKDLHLAAEAFHMALTYPEAEKQSMVRMLEEKIASMNGQLRQLSEVVDSTKNIVDLVRGSYTLGLNGVYEFKDGGNGRLHPARMLKSGRNVGEVLQGLQDKLFEAEAHRASISENLRQAQHKLTLFDTMRHLITQPAEAWAQQLPLVFGGEPQPMDKYYAEYFPKKLTRALTNLLGFQAAHLENIAAPENTERHLLRSAGASVASKLKEINSFLNTQDDDIIELNRVSHLLYDVSQKEGTLGNVYIRTVETLKCILLNMNCPHTSNSTAYLMSQNYDPMLLASSVLQADPENKFAVTAPIDPTLDFKEQIDAATRANIRPSFLVDKGWSIENIQKNQQTNPYLGFEPIIVENESNYDRLPPITDIYSGIEEINPLTNPQIAPSLIPNGGAAIGYVEPMEDIPIKQVTTTTTTTNSSQQQQVVAPATVTKTTVTTVQTSKN